MLFVFDFKTRNFLPAMCSIRSLGKSRSPSQNWVKPTLEKYKHLTGENGYLYSHLKTKFHKDSQTKANTFISFVKSQRGSISTQINTLEAQQKEKNWSILRRIILSIKFLRRLDSSM